MSSMKKKIFIISFIVLIFDQISKIICDVYLRLNESITVINDFFNITYVQNDGAAWSILNNQRILLILIGVLALYFIYKFIDDFKENKRNILAFGLLIGGILGNLLDRIFLGYVRDFLDFNLFGYNYPIFNLGDIGICIGVILLVIASIKGEDYGEVRRKKFKNR